MKFFKQLLPLFLLLISIMALPNVLHAQANPCVDPFDPECPIDDNVIILIAGVILFAAYKSSLFYKQKLAK